MNSDLKRDILMPSETISLANILHIIKDRKEIWQTLYIYDRDQDDHSDRNRRFNRQINKFNRLNSNRDSYLTFDDICALYFYIIRCLAYILQVRFTIIKNINIATVISNQTTSKINNISLSLFLHLSCQLYVNFFA